METSGKMGSGMQMEMMGIVSPKEVLTLVNVEITLGLYYLF